MMIDTSAAATCAGVRSIGVMSAMNVIGRAALMPTLGLIGTQALYPLLWLGGSSNMGAILPGFIVTTASLVYLFLKTTLPIHRRIRAAKHAALNGVREEIERARAMDLPRGELVAILGYREYLERCSEWPFRTSSVVRWSLYLLIPPLTWVGAALIENVVDLYLA